MRSGKINSSIFISIIISMLGVFMFAENLETSGQAVNIPKINYITQITKSSLNIIPENIGSQILGYENKDACKDFKARQIINAYQKAMQKRDSVASRNAMVKWKTGLNCLSENQADDLNKKMAVYVKGLSNKDVALITDPALSLIDVSQDPFEKTELYKELQRRFADSKAFNEMRSSFSNTVGLFLSEPNGVVLERFTQLCKEQTNTIKCSPVFDKLKNYFNDNLKGLGKCSLIDAAETDFMCTQGLVCDPKEFLPSDNKQKEKLLSALGVSSPEKLGPTFMQTLFNVKNNLLEPSSSLISPGQLLENGQKVGSSAEKLCNEIGFKKGKENKPKDQGKSGRIEELLLPGNNADKCKLPDAQEEIQRRASEGNKNLNVLKCFSEPQVDEGDKSIKINAGNTNVESKCLISQGSSDPLDPTGAHFRIQDLKPGEKRCANGICYEKDKDEKIKVSNREKPASKEKSWSDMSYEEKLDDVEKRCGEGASCVADEDGHITFNSQKDGDSYISNNPAEKDTCFGTCGRSPDPNKPNKYGFIVITDEDGIPEAIKCAGGGAGCVGETESSRKLDEQERKAKEGVPEKGGITNPDPHTPPIERPSDDGRSSSCSASERRVLARVKCLYSSSVYGSSPSVLGKQLSSPLTKQPVTEKIIYPQDSQGKKCTTLQANKDLIEMNAAICKEITTRGNPGQEGKGCSFEVSMELQRKPVRATPDPPRG